ncbi:MAG: endonuclease/exonuclease/phosphatase family protein [Pirellulales bacterium]
MRLRVLSYNIHHGEGIDRKLDLERIARVILSVEPDLVALQEVDCKAARTGGVDQPAELARLTKMHVAGGGNIALQGGEYGNAVLSRWPIRRHENHKLPCFESGEQRGMLELEIDLPGNQPLLLLATHLDHRPKDPERLASVKAIAAMVSPRADRPALLVGDLNDLPESPVLAEVGKQWTRTNDTHLATVPVGKTILQIDYILFRPSGRWKALETRVLDEAIASDHRPILAVLELAPAAD